MSPQKTLLILRYELRCAGRKDGDFLLDFLDVVFAGFEVDLVAVVSTTSSDGGKGLLEGRRIAYMLNRNNLARLPLNRFVDHAETATLRDVLASCPSYLQSLGALLGEGRELSHQAPNLAGNKRTA